MEKMEWERKLEAYISMVREIRMKLEKQGFGSVSTTRIGNFLRNMKEELRDIPRDTRFLPYIYVLIYELVLLKNQINKAIKVIENGE